MPVVVKRVTQFTIPHLEAIPLPGMLFFKSCTPKPYVSLKAIPKVLQEGSADCFFLTQQCFIELTTICLYYSKAGISFTQGDSTHLLIPNRAQLRAFQEELQRSTTLLQAACIHKPSRKEQPRHAAGPLGGGKPWLSFCGAHKPSLHRGTSRFCSHCIHCQSKPHGQARSH